MELPLLILGLLLIVLGHQVTMTDADDHEYHLVRDLMRNYDPRIRPSLNSTDALNVTFGLALAQIIDVDEKNQIITTNCWINQVWIDFKLKWDPSKYGGIKVARLPYDSIWRPDILLYNNADISSYGSSISTNVIVTHDGNVTWLSMTIFRSSCTIDVRFFPFDEQNCSMVFSSWTYDGYQVNLVKVGDDGDTSNYIHNSEWMLIKLHAERHVKKYSCCEEPYPDVTYKIQIRRKPLFYVFNMILPCLLITLVALLGFYIPSDSGEKVTMGITTLLSMTVFLMLVTESMPPTSDVLPLIGLYYGITIAIVSLATAMTVLTLNIHHKGVRGFEVPNIVKRVCFGVLSKLLCLKLEAPSPEQTHHVFTSEPDDPSCRNSYIKLKKSRTNGRMQSPSESNRMTILDFVPPYKDSRQTRETKLDMSDRAPENGGLSPRFVNSRFRSSPHHSTGPASASHAHSSDMLGGTSASGENFEKHFLRVLHKVYQTIERNEIRLAEQDRKDVIKLEWKHVALVVDRVLLILFIMGTVGVTLGIMLCAPHSRSDWTGDNNQDEKGLN